MVRTRVFAPAPGSRPAAVSGLINGVAVGFPLLVGVAAGDPVAGALACLGAYLAAFTNKGGPRKARTTGLVVAAGVNVLAFWAGELVTGLFPLALVLLAILVFLASMGETVHGTVARLGTMPATALLVGSGQTDAGLTRTAGAAFLFLCGGLWYATATGLLTPAPRLRGVLAVIAQPFRETSRRLTWTATADSGTGDDHTLAVAALRRAEEAVQALRGPGGDEHLAALLDPLLSQASALVDLTEALTATGAPPRAASLPFTGTAQALADQVVQVADLLTRRPTGKTSPPDATSAMADLTIACDLLRSRAATGLEPYREVARAARQRHLLTRIHTTADTALHEARALRTAADTRLHPSPAPQAPFDAARLRASMTLKSSTYRYALRVTAITTAVFTLVWVAHLPHGQWATLAVVRVLRPEYGATVERVVQRIAGNLIGGTCAALLIAGVSQAGVLAVLLFAVITVGFTLRPVNYAFWVIFGTPLVLLIGDVAQPGDWVFALERIAMTVLGSAAALLGGYLLWPTWQHHSLPDRITDATRASAAYLDATLTWLTHPDTAERMDQARRTAEHALVKARAAHRHAGREPGHDHVAATGASNAIDTLTALDGHLAALTAHPAPQTALIPGLRDFSTHAPTALTAPRADERIDHTAALEDALDDMHLYLDELHTRRLHELATDQMGDTDVRCAIRENEPIVELLAKIERCVEQLTHHP